MKKTTLLSFGTAVISAAIVSFVAYGCGDDDVAATPKPDSGTSSSGGSSGGSSGTSGTDGSTTPKPPALGDQIDRMGRPGINTALQKTFTDNTTREAAQDSYNHDKDKSGWVAKYKEGFAGSLAVYDGIVTCGDQPFYEADAGNGAAAHYGTLASVLADDRLWLDSSATCSNRYLAVELNATTAYPNNDCGGRTLKTDVIDYTYTALAADTDAVKLGADSGAPAVGDSIAATDSKVNGTTFPYLSAPQ